MVAAFGIGRFGFRGSPFIGHRRGRSHEGTDVDLPTSLALARTDFALTCPTLDGFWGSVYFGRCIFGVVPLLRWLFEDLSHNFDEALIE